MGYNTVNLIDVPKECISTERKDVIYDLKRGCYMPVHWKHARKIFDYIDLEKVLTDSEIMMLYRLTKYASPHTNSLYCLKNNKMVPMDKEGIMRVTKRGEWTVNRFLEKCKKAHFIAVISKKYDKEVLSMYCLNPFIAMPGGGWINALLFQLWRDECEKYLSPALLARLEKDSFCKTYDPFFYKDKFGYFNESLNRHHEATVEIFKNSSNGGAH